MTADFVIIGGGCYGTYYVEQLLEARSRGKLEWETLLVLDRDPACAVAQRFADDADVVVEKASWEEWGARIWSERTLWSSCQLVPAPIAPHVVRHWLVAGLRGEGVEVNDDEWRGTVPELPYADVTEAGQLVVSHAPGLCPTNCIEPRMCPLTGGERTWRMTQTVAAAAQDLDGNVSLECSHFAYGVGTIPFDSIYAAFDSLMTLSKPARIGIATVSKCHGLVDVVRLS